MSRDRVVVTREPDDPLAEVRVSLGEARGVGMYVVFRGEPDAAARLMRRGAEELERALGDGTLTDKRGRPQG